MHRDNVFATLTYSPESVPRVRSGFTLRYEDFVQFMKRLRKARGRGVRFLQAGEYGSLGRPHHHVLLFNCRFEDSLFWRKIDGNDYFRSGELERLWPHGFSSLTAVNFETAAYVARYTVKKVDSREARLSRGQVPEMLTMSRRPGIGADWWKRYGGQVMAHDRVVARGGKEMRPPRFYDELFKRFDPSGYEAMKDRRAAKLGVVEAESVVTLRARELNERARLALSRRKL